MAINLDIIKNEIANCKNIGKKNHKRDPVIYDTDKVNIEKP